MPNLPAIVTKEYRDTKEFNKDAPKMAAQGYKVITVMDGKTSLNYVERYFKGQLLQSKKRILVTYQLG